MIFIAFALGIIYSVPLGPLGQIMLNRALNKGFWHGFSVAILASIADFFLCEFFLIGTVYVGFSNPLLRIIFQITGLIFLAYIGIKEFIIPIVKKDNKYKDRKSPTNEILKNDTDFTWKTMLKDVILVGIYCISNPTYIAFWIAFSTVISQKFIVYHSIFYYTIFSLFFSLGSLACQYLAIIFVRKIGKNSIRNSILQYIYVPLYSITIIYFFYHVIHDIIFLPKA